MKSRAAIGGHPLHPIFVTVPVGLWSFAPICDLIYHMGWGDATWKATAFYCIGGGILGAIPAVITGYIDYGIVQGVKAAAIAKFHLILNAIVTTVFLISFGLRYQEFRTHYFSLIPVFLSFGGAALLGISGYLGGELVSRFGVSVDRANQEKSGN